MKTKKANYVNNKQFLKLLNEYKENKNAKIENEIGKIIILIANQLASRYNFQNYTYKEEMIGDGILKAYEALNNFDSNKSNNPFAFFTQIIFNSFIARIRKEKQFKKMQNQMLLEVDLFYEDELNSDIITRDDIIGDFEVDY